MPITPSALFSSSSSRRNAATDVAPRRIARERKVRRSSKKRYGVKSVVGSEAWIVLPWNRQGEGAGVEGEYREGDERRGLRAALEDEDMRRGRMRDAATCAQCFAGVIVVVGIVV